jgi:BirA family biotin operon repressor/biotin-[acetyl-CoA-carboxylase] ligase
VLALAEVDSTSSELRRRLAAGALPGTVVVADRQTAGRGRQGKSWLSLETGNLYLSLATSLRANQPDPSAAVRLVPLAAGVSAVEAVRKHSGVQTELKWPNDVLHAGRKLSGILCELPQAKGRQWTPVVGIGINIADTSFPPELEDRATSLVRHCPALPSREELAASWVAALEVWIERIAAGRGQELLQAWKQRAEPFGRQVRIGSVQGETVDLDQEGQLLVRCADGSQVALGGGVVEHL